MKCSCTVALLLSIYASIACGLKILLFIPGLSRSQYLFNNRLGCALQSHGHNVSLVNSIWFNYVGRNHPPCNITQIELFNTLVDDEQDHKHEMMLQEIEFNDTTNKGMAELYSMISKVNYNICSIINKDDDVMDRLHEANFDLVLAQGLTYCNLGIALELKVPIVWVSGGNYIFDFMADSLSLPFPSSFVPSTTSIFSDKMNFFERMHNLYFNLMSAIAVRCPEIGPNIGMLDAQVSKLTPASRVPNLFEVARDIPVTLLNGDPIIDYARPIFPGIYQMSEFEMQSELPESTKTMKLSEKWQRIVDKSSKGFVLVSFGTMADTERMPQQMKDDFLDAFRKFPDYIIIWKVSSLFPIPGDITHMHLATWIPQRQLLENPKAKLFVTHGGYNSLLETTQAGVPIISIPLFFDQYGNAHRAARLGASITIYKDKLNAQTLYNAMAKILLDSKYKLRAAKLSRMLADQPFPRDKMIVYHIERAHRHFYHLPRILMPQKLYAYQYYCLDVIVAAISVFLLTVTVVMSCVFRICSSICKLP